MHTIVITNLDGVVRRKMLGAVFETLDGVSPEALASGQFWRSQEDLESGVRIDVRAVGFAGASSGSGVLLKVGVHQRGFLPIFMEATLQTVQPDDGK
ncbi:MAG TPA: hypothetical protein VJJ47_02180 [Candidatus Paceibacterota bacterium]